MTDGFEIPDNLKGTYQRMLQRAPEQLRTDSAFRHLTLLHLKVGGERLARQNTELFRFRLEEEVIFGRGFLGDRAEGENEPGEEIDSAGNGEASENEEEDDDLEDDPPDDEDADDDDDYAGFNASGESDRYPFPDRGDFESFAEIWANGSQL